MIGSFLVAQVETLVDIDTLAETLNALFDMYSDAEFDYDTPVYRSLGFNARLKALQGSVQSRVKALDKRTQGPTRARGEEALQNLKAFVSYKESEAGARSPSR